MSRGYKSLIVAFVGRAETQWETVLFSVFDAAAAVKTYWIRGAATLEALGDACELLSACL